MVPFPSTNTSAGQLSEQHIMEPPNYPVPQGVHIIPPEDLDLRPDSAVDHDLLHPKPVSDSEKNIWFFWHSGYGTMHPYAKRDVRAWHRRFSRKGWTVRVLDRAPGSPLNVANFLDVEDPGMFILASSPMGTLTHHQEYGI